MKKGKLTLTITIGIACLALALVMTMQFKVVSEIDLTSIDLMREAELRTELANWRSRYEEATEQLQLRQAKLDEYRTNIEQNIENADLVKRELEQVNMLLGRTDVEGEGIIITIKDNSGDPGDFTRIQSDDLLLLVDNLRLAGAEAISVNEERITNMSDFAFINNAIIRVNQQRILSPFVIKAIGDQSYMESSLLGSGGFVEELRKLGHDVNIERASRVQIPRFSREFNVRFMN